MANEAPAVNAPATTTSDAGAAAPAPGNTQQAAPATDATNTTMLGNAAPQGQPNVPADFEIKLPEGFKADTAAMAEWKKSVQALGLDPKVAQTVAQQGADVYAKAVQSIQQMATEEVEAQHKQWVEAVKADKEIGGQNLQQTTASIQRVMQAYPNREALQKYLNESRGGDNPEMVRFVNWVGKQFGEDRIRGTIGNTPPPSNGKTDLMKAWFPNSPDLHKEP